MHISDKIQLLDIQLDRVPALFTLKAVGKLLWAAFPIEPTRPDFENRYNSVQFDFSTPGIDKTVKQRHLEQYTKQNENGSLLSLKVYFVLDANKMPRVQDFKLCAKIKSLFQDKFS